MKTSKITALALASLIAVSLCGCNNEPQTSDSSDSGSSSTISSDNSSNSTVSSESADKQTSSQNSDIENTESSDTSSKPREKTILIGALNDEIDHSEIVEAIKYTPGKTLEISPDRIDEDRADRVTAGVAYCALPLYPCLTDRESEYDEANQAFKDIPRQEKSDYIKVRPGEKICGLTVAEASTEFYLGENGGRTKMRSSHIKLDGSITTEGYIRIVKEPEYAVGFEGDMIFVPVGNVQLPAVRFDSRDINANVIEFRNIGNPYMMEGLTFTNEFSGFFDLDNINDTTVDLSEIPNDGSFVKVKAVISDFEMQSTIEWFTTASAVLESVTRID